MKEGILDIQYTSNELGKDRMEVRGADLIRSSNPPHPDPLIQYIALKIA
jgi:hypothetical protein